ncbi:MAG: hypothetical protein LIP23_03130 [Planctomycetes bacterium]|nr:hypothetical protein [Planctomycetota bacterium]
MPTGNKVYFLADMHVKPLDAPNEQAREMARRDNERLAAFLQSIQDQAKTLILLGDAFNFWFERFGKILGDYDTTLALFKLASDNGLDIHHVSGNRDFVVGEGLGLDPNTRYPGYFRAKSGFTVSRLCDFGIEPHGPRHRFHHNGTTVSCIHGDSLCTGDRMFMLLRWVLTGPIGKTGFRWMPRYFLDPIVSAQQGRTGLRGSALEPAELFDKEAIKREIAMGADLLVCGHIHARFHKDIEIAGRTGRLEVVPPWMDGWYAVLDDDGFQVREFA